MQFILYCVCGGIGVASDYLTFSFLLKIAINYQIANAVGYAVGTLISFILNRRITFGIKDQVVRRMLLFFTVAAIGFLTSAAMMKLFVDLIAIDAHYAKLLTLPVVVILQFSLNRWITFRQNRHAAIISK